MCTSLEIVKEQAVPRNKVKFRLTGNSPGLCTFRMVSANAVAHRTSPAHLTSLAATVLCK